MKKEKIRVGILFGGQSAEHEVSLQSALNIVDAIDKEKYLPVLIGIDKTGRWILNEKSGFLLHADDPRLIKLNAAGDKVALIPQEKGRLRPISKGGGADRVDVVFPILHGPMGEDGTVQGLLKLAGVPFVGAGVLGSAVGMDKDVMKRLLRDAGIPIAEFLALKATDDIPAYAAIVKRLGNPFFVKPANLGSSVGVSKVRSEAEYGPAVNTAFEYDQKIMIEAFVQGRELECAVLGNDDPKASVPGEVVPVHDFYSYEAKYIDEKGALLEIPARVEPQIIEEIQKLAVETFKVLACAGMARVDFFLTPDQVLVVNEINTIPGFTAISMYPRLWQASGISYADLIDRLIELALERFAREQRLKTTI